MPAPSTPSSGRATQITTRTTPTALANHLHSLTTRDSRPRSASPPLRSPSPSALSPTRDAMKSRVSASTPNQAFQKAASTERGSPLRLDDAIVTTSRCRDESERVMGEVLAGIERSFQPNDDKRLVCRAYVVQLGRTNGRLRDAAQRLEKEAADAIHAASHEKAELLARMHHLSMQSEGHSSLLQSEVERSEAERKSQGNHMHSEFERLRREREDESGRLGSDVARLSASLEASRAETAALWQQAQAQQKVMTADNEALRTQVVHLQSELAASTDAHGIDASTLRAELTLLAAEKQAMTTRLRADLSYMTQLASETESRLESQLVMLKVEKETTVEGLRHEMKRLVDSYDAQVRELTQGLRDTEAAKEHSEVSLRGMMRRMKAEKDDEAAQLRHKIHRLSSVQKQAMDAGTLRARQILFWDSVRGDESDPSMTWRGAAEELPEYGGAGSRSISPTRGWDEGGERLNAPMTPLAHTPQRRIESPS